MHTPPDQDRDPDHSESPAGAEVRDGQSPPKPRRWRRRLGILGAIGLLLMLAVIFLGPVVIAWVARSLIVDAGERHGYTVTVASSSFDWWEGLTLEGIVAQENIPHGIRAEAESVVAAPRWRGLLGGTWALGRFRIDRPSITVDPAREPPERPPLKKASKSSPPSSKAGTEEQPALDEPLNVEFPLTVVDGTIEVLPAADRPGLRLEHLNVNGRLRGPDRHFNGTVVGDLVAGNRREPLRLSGDIDLGDRRRKPSGSGQYAVGEIDLTCLEPFLKTRGGPIVKRGTLRMNGELRAEGPVLRLVGSAILRNLELAHPDDPARVFEAPRAELEVKASYDPIRQRLVLEWGRIEGAPIDLELEGFAATAAGPGRTAELTIRPQGRIERLASLVPDLDGISGALGGTLKVRHEKNRTAVGADLTVTDLVWKLPGEPGTPGTSENTIRDPRLTTHLELVAGPKEEQAIPASGTVKLIGSALRLDATFDAKAFPDDLHVKGTMGGGDSAPAPPARFRGARRAPGRRRIHQRLRGQTRGPLRGPGEEPSPGDPGAVERADERAGPGSPARGLRRQRSGVPGQNGPEQGRAARSRGEGERRHAVGGRPDRPRATRARVPGSSPVQRRPGHAVPGRGHPVLRAALSHP